MRHLTWLLLLALAAGCAPAETKDTAPADILPSWNDGPARQSIIDFVERVTTPGSADFVEPEERIVTIDNDGTLWTEQPAYFQFLFAIDRVRAMAPDHPEWKDKQPFKAVLENDMATVAAAGDKGIIQLVMATHAGMTSEEFSRAAKDWLDTARHPRFDRPFTELVFQPMLELMDYLRANDFRIWICSGGGVEFMRVFVEQTYGIPPERVIGSTIKTRFEMRKTGPAIVREAGVDYIDDKDGKPLAIHRIIGRRPIMAFGNSDGDLPMIQWVTAGDGARFGGYIHHTDAEREWAYDRESHIGQLDKGLDEAAAKGWTVVDMKQDWKVVYPPVK